MAQEAVEFVIERVSSWEIQRDTEHRKRWDEYYRMWRGIWDPMDRDRESERSRVIMPAIQQAIESAVAEMVEATFGRERWFDAQEPAWQELADRLLVSLWPMRGAFAEVFILGALYGTGLAKIVVERDRPFSQRLQPLEPFEFVLDPAAQTIDESLGVAHVMYVPRHVVERRMKEGLYAQVDLTDSTADLSKQHRHSREQSPRDTDLVRLVEWHGLVPARMVDGPETDGVGEDDLTESIVTVANDLILLRADQNPLEDRGFVAYQHDTVPRRFWGRGIAEKGYWPAKALDAEIRARIDALAFSTHPMMGVNAQGMPRGERFAVRPGRNILVNGNPDEVLKPITFPPPDPQTYVQSQEMMRMVELATGQIQSAADSIDTRNAPASGISMIFGASVRRTKKALSNVERQFLDPVIRKLALRYSEFDPEYRSWRGLVETFKPRFHGTLGYMARELEMQQLLQLLSAVQPGPVQTGLIRLVLENSALTDKSEILDMLADVQGQQLSQGEQDLSGQARMISAISRAEEGAANLELKAKALDQAFLKEASLNAEREREHQRALMDLSFQGQRQETEALSAQYKALETQTRALLNVANAEAAEMGSQIEQYRAVLETLQAAQGGAEADGEARTQGQIDAALQPILARLEAMTAPAPAQGNGQAGGPITLERDERGLVRTINGRRVNRNAQGLIAGVEGG